MNYSSHFCILREPVEGTLCRITQIIKEDAEQYLVLAYTPRYQSPARLCTTKHYVSLHAVLTRDTSHENRKSVSKTRILIEKELSFFSSHSMNRSFYMNLYLEMKSF